jgi:hypothetical protein
MPWRARQRFKRAQPSTGRPARGSSPLDAMSEYYYAQNPLDLFYADKEPVPQADKADFRALC